MGSQLESLFFFNLASKPLAGGCLVSASVGVALSSTKMKEFFYDGPYHHIPLFQND
jgi:hypothetical protein